VEEPPVLTLELLNDSAESTWWFCFTGVLTGAISACVSEIGLAGITVALLAAKLDGNFERALKGALKAVFPEESGV